MTWIDSKGYQVGRRFDPRWVDKEGTDLESGESIPAEIEAERVVDSFDRGGRREPIAGSPGQDWIGERDTKSAAGLFDPDGPDGPEIGRHDLGLDRADGHGEEVVTQVNTSGRSNPCASHSIM